MASQLWDDDERVLADLGEALRDAGPVTFRMRDAGRVAYSWRLVDEELELAQLVYDSSVEVDGLVRSSGTPRMLVFEGPTLSVEVEVGDEGVSGQLLPPAPGLVSVTAADGRVAEANADGMGAFLVAGAPIGPVQLRCRTEAAGLVTGWVLLARR